MHTNALHEAINPEAMGDRRLKQAPEVRSSTSPLTPLECSVENRFARACSASYQLDARFLAGWKLVPHAAELLQLLRLQPGSTISEIGAQLNISKGWVSRLIDDLQARGYVRGDRTDEDGRVVRVFLQGRGTALLDEVATARSQLIASALEGICIEEIDTLLRFFEQMETRLKTLLSTANATPLWSIGPLDS